DTLSRSGPPPCAPRLDRRASVRDRGRPRSKGKRQRDCLERARRIRRVERASHARLHMLRKAAHAQLPHAAAFMKSQHWPALPIDPACPPAAPEPGLPPEPGVNIWMVGAVVGVFA